MSTSTYPAHPPSPQFEPAPGGPRRRRRRRPLAIVAAVVTGLIVAAAIAGGEPAREPDSGAVVEPGTLSALDLRVGDCYNTSVAPPAPGTSQPITTVAVVPCAEPHTDQVVAKIAYGAGDTRDAVVRDRASADCQARVGQDVDPQALAAGTFQVGWIAAGDDASWLMNRSLACIVVSATPTTGSVLR